jgi:hypothetical protein
VVAQFELVAAVDRAPLQRDPADHPAGGRENDGVESRPDVAYLTDLALQPEARFLMVQRFRQPPEHARVGVDGGHVGEVVPRVRADAQTLG